MLAGWGRKVVKVSMSIDKSTITIMCQSSDAEKIVVTQALLNYNVFPCYPSHPPIRATSSQQTLPLTSLSSQIHNDFS